MSILTETRERFLKAIVAQVEPDRIAEIHFFQPLKQAGVESGVAVVVERGAPDAPERIVIFTARYRLTLKGPDRGKWETNIVAEADAPLVTVEAVVSGVQRRAGDVDDPTRMDGDEVRTYLDPRWSPAPVEQTPASAEEAPAPEAEQTSAPEAEQMPVSAEETPAPEEQAPAS